MRVAAGGGRRLLWFELCSSASHSASSSSWPCEALELLLLLVLRGGRGVVLGILDLAEVGRSGSSGGYCCSPRPGSAHGGRAGGGWARGRVRALSFRCSVSLSNNAAPPPPPPASSAHQPVRALPPPARTHVLRATGLKPVQLCQHPRGEPKKGREWNRGRKVIAVVCVAGALIQSSVGKEALAGARHSLFKSHSPRR